MDEIRTIAEALGSRVLATRRLAGGFSHETCLVTLADGQVVVRLGGPDPAVEAAVMATARRHVPVPEVLLVVAAAGGEPAGRPAMVIEYVSGTPLEQVLGADGSTGPPLGDLGTEVGRVVANIGAATYDRPGFFADGQLTVRGERPWSVQLPEVAASCMDAVQADRLDRATRDDWMKLCAAHAPALARVDPHARLVHADINPKNILVGRDGDAWRVVAVLDWEFSYAGCPYGDAANMLRFAADYPAEFVDGFRAGFAQHQPADLPLADDWAYLGRVLDMFALSDLVTRPSGNPVADQAAARIRRLVTDGIPG
ncbi:phosphotransferase [Plantactinospora sp. KLBMP9567]|uniref:phosphotransferase n=1 Tax=Plantactinospora sp. KLBMP9567 TaxID=3085900 RepID=UPI002981087C|nr:phosphotransferase [Plantactinospora sp. KLBMP9567]MDW5330375.1 phosphotransferase [Plantactinospora sp. KLBMP9567]